MLGTKANFLFPWIWYSNSISTIARKFGDRQAMPLGEAVFLCVAAFVASFLVSSGEIAGEKGVLGGPLPAPILGSVPSEGISLIGYPLIARASQETHSDANQYKEAFSATLSDEGAIFGSVTAQGGVVLYSVKKGDTLSGIASQFGVSVETILGANPSVKSRYLQVGQEIKILSVSGILYQVRDGETPESIASSFNLSLSQLREFNRSVDFNTIGAGNTLLIPGVRPINAPRGLYDDLPRIAGYFISPAQGFNWGRLHSYNAVDIANTCGTEVAAAAEGLVVPDKEYGSGATGWNGGYGKFVLIEHPNGTKTRYAHLDDVSVEIGSYVSQGQEVGAMGNTGNVHGPTGCHLHFEVYGAYNILAK